MFAFSGTFLCVKTGATIDGFDCIFEAWRQKTETVVPLDQQYSPETLWKFFKKSILLVSTVEFIELLASGSAVPCSPWLWALALNE